MPNITLTKGFAVKGKGIGYIKTYETLEEAIAKRDSLF
jgi:hypothetical protein